MRPGVSVTYDIVASPGSADVAQIQKEIESQLKKSVFPLRNLHWKLSKVLPLTKQHDTLVSQVKTIQELDVQLRKRDTTGEKADKMGSEADEKSSSSSHELDLQLVDLLFVVCEDTDTYKLSIRQSIRDWFEIHAAPDDATREWLIVYLPAAPAAPVSAATKIFKPRSKSHAVFERLRSDFNTQKRERCLVCDVAHAGDADPAAFLDLSLRLKDSLIAALDARVAAAIDRANAANSEENSFLELVHRRVALATILEALGFAQDALDQYTDLDALYVDAIVGNERWAEGGAGGATARAAAAAVPFDAIDTAALAARIADETIAPIELRMLFFASAMRLLAATSPTLVPRHAMRAATALAVALRRAGVEELRVLSFLYGNVMAAAGAGEENSPSHPAASLRTASASPAPSSTSHTPPTPEAGLAVRPRAGAAFSENSIDLPDLLFLARIQLDKLGLHYGHLPHEQPFTQALSAVQTANSSKDTRISDPGEQETRISDQGEDISTQQSDISLLGPTLARVAANREAFYSLYSDLTTHIIHLYNVVSQKYNLPRKRTVLRLHASLAALELCRGRLEPAQKLYSQLPGYYTDTHWKPIESHLLLRSYKIQSELGMQKDSLLSALALLRSNTISDPEDCQRLVDEIRERSSALTKDFAASSFPAFQMELESRLGTHTENEDGSLVSLKVTNYLPCSFPADEIRLKFSAQPRYGERPGHHLKASSFPQQVVWFTAGKTVLQPGATKIAVFSSTPIHGLLTLELSQIRSEKITFQYSHVPKSDLTSYSEEEEKRSSREIRSPSGSISRRDSTTGGPAMFYNRHDTLLYRHIGQLERIQSNTVVFSQDYKAFGIVGGEVKEVKHGSNPHVLPVVAYTGRNYINKAILKFDVLSTGANMLPIDQAFLIESSGVSLEASIEEGTLTLIDVPPNTRIEIGIPYTTTGNHVVTAVAVDYFNSRRPTIRRSLRRTLSYRLDIPLAVDYKIIPGASSSLLHLSIQNKNAHQTLSTTPVVFESQDNTLGVQRCGKVSGNISILPSEKFQYMFKILNREATTCHMDFSFSTALRDTALNLRTRARVLAEAANLLAYLLWLDTVAVPQLASAVGTEDWNEIVKKEISIEADRANIITLIESLARNDEAYEARDHDWIKVSVPVGLSKVSIFNSVSVRPVSDEMLISTTVGQLIPIKVSILPVFFNADRESCELIYELEDNPEQWVIQGPRRKLFVAKNQTKIEVDLNIVPLKPGTLFLPACTIVNPRSEKDGLVAHFHVEDASYAVHVDPILHPATFKLL